MLLVMTSLVPLTEKYLLDHVLIKSDQNESFQVFSKMQLVQTHKIMFTALHCQVTLDKTLVMFTGVICTD